MEDCPESSLRNRAANWTCGWPFPQEHQFSSQGQPEPQVALISHRGRASGFRSPATRTRSLDVDPGPWHWADGCSCLAWLGLHYYTSLHCDMGVGARLWSGSGKFHTTFSQIRLLVICYSDLGDRWGHHCGCFLIYDIHTTLIFRTFVQYIQIFPDISTAQ